MNARLLSAKYVLYFSLEKTNTYVKKVLGHLERIMALNLSMLRKGKLPWHVQYFLLEI